MYIALGAIPGSPQLRILTALYDLLISREFVYSVCNFVDALVAIYRKRVLVGMYVLGMYVFPTPPLEVGLVGCSPLLEGGTRQQASLEARWTRAPAGL